MAIDEPEFLPFRAAMNAPAWGHQLGSPSSSMPPNAGPSWPSLSMLAPSWDSPPLLLEVQPSASDQQWESWQGSHSMPSLATIVPSWDSPTSSPATVPSPLEHACMDERLDGMAAARPQPILATSQQPSPEPMATDATAVTWVYKEFMMKGQLQHQWKKHGGLQFFSRDRLMSTHPVLTPPPMGQSLWPTTTTAIHWWNQASNFAFVGTAKGSAGWRESGLPNGQQVSPSATQDPAICRWESGNATASVASSYIVLVHVPSFPFDGNVDDNIAGHLSSGCIPSYLFAVTASSYPASFYPSSFLLLSGLGSCPNPALHPSSLHLCRLLPPAFGGTLWHLATS
ncbi:hypothetical protein BKA82DRAFT_4021662 [Pisolithus tinctorius]|nr:hypothetical protein BKA82DRAFT_4021662 [Pisolithus tinctorius]